MRKIFIVIVIVIFVSIVFLCFYNINNNFNYELELDNKIGSLKESNIENKILLLSTMGFSNLDKIINEDKINEQLEMINLKSGIFITEGSRNEVIDIIKKCTGEELIIDSEGYLQKKDSNNDICMQINEMIESNKTFIISIDGTYESIIQDVVYEFMIENTKYVQNFEYNNSLRISLINPEQLQQNNEENLSKKEICEEILLNILKHKF